MRVSARISSAGGNGFTRLPCLGCKISDLCTDGNDEHLDEDKVRRHLRSFEGVRHSSGDCIQVYAFVIEVMHQVESACQQLIDNADADVRSSEDTADDRHARRNMDKGRFVYASYDVIYSPTKCETTVKLDIDNPKNVVGSAERIARDYLIVVARCILFMVRELTKSGGTKYRLVGGKGCPDIFDEAREAEAEGQRRHDARESNRQRCFCKHFHGTGFCGPDADGNPPKFDCPHYKIGKCVALEVIK